MRSSYAVEDSLGRRSRMRASSTGKRVRLTDRDRLWLEAIHRHGPLASTQLLAFAKEFGVSGKRAQERLTDLFHEDNTVHGGPYFVRPPQQFQTIDARYKPLVYELAPAGVRALKQHDRWSDAAGPSGGPWWHSFMTASITASIELATQKRSDLSFISQSAILERANSSISSSVQYLEPAVGKTFTKTLTPDAVFGLQYHTPQGRRFRFFAVEADRGTEPLTSCNANRKSVIRNFAMYDAYIRGGLYKQHLNLTAPLLVLNVCSSEQRLRSMIETLSASGLSAPYQLFQLASDDHVGDAWKRDSTEIHIA